MANAELVYTVRDRSLLLPLYKRAVVEPTIRKIPARVDPNWITHAGHAVNFAGLVVLLAAVWRGSPAPWPFLAAALSLQIYNWCDNADGAHARRTGRSSALGELLDHGLDMLNVTYIAFIAATAVGAPPLWWLAIAILVPAACAVTYWEQAETGLFVLGMLNQIESVMVLSAVLVTTALLGLGVYDRVHVGPVTLRLAITTFVCVTALVGIARNVARVRSHASSRALLRVLPLVVYDVAVMVAVLVHALSPAAAVVVATAGNVFFGVRCLAMRTAGEAPRFEPGLAWGAALILGFSALSCLRLGGMSTSIATDVVAAVSASVFFGLYALLNARDATRAVVRIDAASRS